MFLERKPEPKIPDERMKELIEIKNKQRAAMKADYLKQILNPYRHATGEGGAPVSTLDLYKVFYSFDFRFN